VRVIAGRLGGRRLRAPKGKATTRPTSDRVKEALFSMLGDLDGAVALDLFAGTGALGIEAISRGANRAVFVERDRAAATAIRTNLASLGLDRSRAELRVGDVGGALRAAREAGETYDLVFVDPPYDHAREWADRLAELLPAVLAPGARVVLESDRRAPAALPLAVARQKHYGDTTITIHVTEDHDER
jgi:16S rRNA (guanine966-N2)-methyltransferase